MGLPSRAGQAPHSTAWLAVAAASLAVRSSLMKALDAATRKRDAAASPVGQEARPGSAEVPHQTLA